MLAEAPTVNFQERPSRASDNAARNYEQVKRMSADDQMHKSSMFRTSMGRSAHVHIMDWKGQMYQINYGGQVINSTTEETIVITCGR
jgi:hypothetical protein